MLQNNHTLLFATRYSGIGVVLRRNWLDWASGRKNNTGSPKVYLGLGGILETHELPTFQVYPGVSLVPHDV